MSVVTIPTPGMTGGPCRGSCNHSKCHTLRAMADERCSHCGVRFGFGTKITGEPPLHLRCAQSISARNGAPATHPIHDPAAGHHVAGHQGDKR
ncbi:MAG TPA: hypothetical protein VJX68_14455 [Candidatus Binatus sp.]|uniref:hypothetical protein n=1 Tax=Candidatus Binatus sp. TaxID=2811406 RepID=UPI002B46BA39|nr:hypothetical protein [Candidatus Binatus sp.]HKN14389.1 hypothetical protein [Candidatus Binatus sp.]